MNVMIMLSNVNSSSMHHQDTTNLMQNMDPRMQMKVSPSSSRILYDIPCKVCRDHSSGKHYGIFACDGCAGFFKRSIRRNRQYVCKAKSEGTCIVDKTHRNQCRACRLAKCQEAGMNKEAVQHERGPRNSTLRRQMALFFKDPNDIGAHHHARLPPGIMPPLDLSISQSSPPPPALISPHAYMCNPVHLPRFPIGLPMAPSTAMTPVLNPETVCESAARLLFMNVKWAKSVPAFTTLPLPDQLLLLEESWSELFVLGAAQFLIPLELGQLVHACGALNTSTDADPTKTLKLLHEVKLFQETLARFVEIRVDPHEFACLRAIVLFKTSFDGTSSSSSMSPTTSSDSTSSTTGEPKILTSIGNVVSLQDHTQFTLNKYILTTQPGQPLRFGKLLLLLPALKSVSNSTIVELFFKKTIGDIPIERIICDMYKSNNDV